MIKSISLIDQAGKLKHYASGGVAFPHISGFRWMSVPVEAGNPQTASLRTTWTGPLDFYTAKGQPIIKNQAAAIQGLTNASGCQRHLSTRNSRNFSKTHSSFPFPGHQILPAACLP